VSKIKIINWTIFCNKKTPKVSSNNLRAQSVQAKIGIEDKALPEIQVDSDTLFSGVNFGTFS